MIDYQNTSDVIKEIKHEDNHVTLYLTGEIDMSNAPDLRGELLLLMKEPIETVRLNMEEVGFMDSSGVAVLVETLQVAHRHQKKIQLSTLHPRVKSIFEISRLVDMFEIIDQD